MTNSKELLEYTKNLTLLFAEDHDELRVNTAEILKNFFKKVDTVSNGEEALHLYKKQLLTNQKYDIVITDIQMPRMDGVALTQHIYDLTPSQAVLVLSAHDESKYLLALINLGIEQFIKKPIDYQELLKALLDVSKKLTSPTATVVDRVTIQLNHDFTFNRETKILLHKTQSITLTKYEIIFLEYITRDLGKIYSNEDIVANFSALDESIDPQNIRKLVSKLRKKLPEGALESIYGVGYRIVPFYS